MEWHIGQRVVAIESFHDMASCIEKGRIYTVQGVTRCSCATRLLVDLTVFAKLSGTACLTCSWSIWDGNTWPPAHFLRPLDDLEQQLAKIESEVAHEPVELIPA